MIGVNCKYNREGLERCVEASLEAYVTCNLNRCRINRRVAVIVCKRPVTEGVDVACVLSLSRCCRKLISCQILTVLEVAYRLDNLITVKECS